MKKFHLGNLPPSLQRRILEAELDISNGLKANLPAEMPKEQTRTFSSDAFQGMPQFGKFTKAEAIFVLNEHNRYGVEYKFNYLTFV